MRPNYLIGGVLDENLETGRPNDLILNARGSGIYNYDAFLANEILLANIRGTSVRFGIRLQRESRFPLSVRLFLTESQEENGSGGNRFSASRGPSRPAR